MPLVSSFFDQYNCIRGCWCPEEGSWVQYSTHSRIWMSCVTRIQQHGVLGIHKPLETKTNGVEKDLIVEKYKPNSSAAFWRLCFQALMFYEWCLGTAEVARMWKEQTVQCQEQIMWLQVSLLARRTKGAAKLRLEIPTEDIKLETVLCWKQRGVGETAIRLLQQGNSCALKTVSRSRKIRFQEEGEAAKLPRDFAAVHWKPWVGASSWPCRPAAPASRLPPAAAALPFRHPSPAGCARCSAASGQPPACRGQSQRVPVRQNQQVWFCCRSLIRAGTRWQKKAQKA